MIRDEIDDVLATVGTTSRVDRLRRNSLMALRDRFSPPPAQLRVDLGGEVTAMTVARLTEALQRATALAAKALLEPKNAAINISPQLLERAPLVPHAQSRGTLYFEFPSTDATGDVADRSSIAHLSEHAVRELIEIMPESAGDERALEALPSRRPQYRAALKYLAQALGQEASMSMALKATGGAAVEKSVLTADQARSVPELLSGAREARESMTVKGIMDGLRTRRRLFFLEEFSTGTEYSGAIDEDQLPTVMGLVSRPVIAKLERLVTYRADGSRSHPSYRLIDVVADDRLV